MKTLMPKMDKVVAPESSGVSQALLDLNERIRKAKLRIKACDDLNTDTQTIRRIYESWAQDYETDVLNYGYRGYMIMLRIVQQFVTNKHARILHVCAGTGLDAQLLYQTGYDNLDGHDGCQQMLSIAKQKNIFNQLYCEWLQPHQQSGLPSNTYDVLVCVGCIGPTHLHVAHLDDLLRPLKKNGLLIIGLREMYVRPENGQYDLDAFVVGWAKQHTARCIARRTCHDYYPGYSGVFYVLKKM